ncbi:MULTISPECIES: hypothetical protein [Citricoccus]|uniref:hypothetical protein n=1 Tax=Citricoccus TaxID=169133 RepID=UPI000255DFC5|nr:hypothetical protein [Citricoccus sp. CH26A]
MASPAVAAAGVEDGADAGVEAAGDDEAGASVAGAADADGDSDADAEAARVSVGDAAWLDAEADGLALGLALELAGEEAGVGVSVGTSATWQAVRPRESAAARPATARRGRRGVRVKLMPLSLDERRA